jgi:hypothetical protein
MVQQTKGLNGTSVRNAVRTEGNMSFQRNQISDARPTSSTNSNSFARANEKAYNGTTSLRIYLQWLADTCMVFANTWLLLQAMLRLSAQTLPSQAQRDRRSGHCSVSCLTLTWRVT